MSRCRGAVVRTARGPGVLILLGRTSGRSWWAEEDPGKCHQVVGYDRLLVGDMRTPRGHVPIDSEVCQHRPVEIRRGIRCSGRRRRSRPTSSATTFLGRTARVRVPPSAAAHSACAWAPLHHHHRRHRLADRGRGLGLVDYCEKSKTFRMMPRSKTSSAWCVSCVGVLSGTGARGRECKRADPHPLNLELDPRSWPPTLTHGAPSRPSTISSWSRPTQP